MLDDFDKEALTMLGIEIGKADQAIHGGYKGASQFDQQVALWSPYNTSADANVIADKYMATSRTRDLRRNDAYVQAGSEYHRDSVVGAHYRLQHKPNWEALGKTKEWAREHSKEVESQWEAYAESENCYLDAAGRNKFTAMVRLQIMNYIEHQECLATVEWIRDRARPAATAILMIDPDRLATPFNKGVLATQSKVRGGVERNRYGRPLAYYIHDGYPYEAPFTGNYEYRRVLARKPWGRRQVIHIMEQQRVDQSRGISQIVTALKQTKMAEKFRDITLQNAVLNATYAATIESELPTDQLFQMLGNGNEVDPVQTYLGLAAEQMTAMSGYAKGAKHLTMDGVKIPHLYPGTKLNLHNPSAPGGVGQEFETSLLRYLAASLGLTYEELTRDLSQTNYSSIKAGMNMTQRAMASRKAMVADRFASQCFEVWYEEQINNGRFKTLNGTSPDFYKGMNREYYTKASWIGAGQGQVDEMKETQAAILRIKRGLSTYQIELARLHGSDYLEVFEQIAYEQGLLETMGITFEEDNALNAASGTVNEANTDTGDNSSDGATDD